MATLTVGRENSTAVELFYQDQGAGAPVVLVHGYPLAAESWEKQIPVLLDEGHRVITYDRRGCGRSSGPAGSYERDTLASDLNMVMSALDLHQVALVGHSAGTGDVARYLARYGSRRVNRVAFIAPVGLQAVPDGAPATSAAGAADRYAELSAVIDDYYNADVFLGSRISPEAVHHSWSAALNASPECAQRFAAAVRSDIRADLERIDIPALLIVAGADRLVSADAGTANGIDLPLLRRMILPDAPHGLLWTHAADVNDALLHFIDG